VPYIEIDRERSCERRWGLEGAWRYTTLLDGVFDEEVDTQTQERYHNHLDSIAGIIQYAERRAGCQLSKVYNS
jgi:hypothetical protein